MYVNVDLNHKGLSIVKGAGMFNLEGFAYRFYTFIYFLIRDVFSSLLSFNLILFRFKLIILVKSNYLLWPPSIAYLKIGDGRAKTKNWLCVF